MPPLAAAASARAGEPRRQPAFFAFLRVALCLSLALSAAAFFAVSWRWPLVGDASLIHYIAFLIGKGWAPYRQLGDMNLPGAFLLEIAAMHLYGPGDLAWRLYDFTLVLIASAALFVILAHPAPARPPAAGPQALWQRRLGALLPGLFASALFILAHGRDGLAQGGQRDLAMAVFLIAGTACLFHSVRLLSLSRSGSIAAAAAFGLLAGVAATLKPTALALTALQLALAWAVLPRAYRARLTLVACAAWLVAPLACLVFLLREHALAAFLAGLGTVVPYYASLGHRPLGFVLVHSISSLQALVPAWLVALALRPPRLRWWKSPPADASAARLAASRQPLWEPLWETLWERDLLLLGVLWGLANCVLQPRALPYYRYPLFVFLLPVLAGDLACISGLASAPQALLPSRSELRRRLAQAVALLALAVGSFFVAPRSAVLLCRYQWWRNDFISSLQQNLDALGGSALSGHIQCIDSISGCGNVLYRMRLQPATGVLSDFLLFGNSSDAQPPDAIPIVRQTRAAFWSAIQLHPPQVIVVSSHLHMEGPEDFGKLARWPAFDQLLRTRYRLAVEWHPTGMTLWWPRPELQASYRIYMLCPQTACPAR